MARGTTLAVCLSKLKAEIGNCLTAGVAPAQDASLKQLLANKQAWLAAEFDWPFLEVTKTVDLVASTRYYALPSGISLDLRPVEASVYYGYSYFGVEPGITEEQYAITDSNQNQTSDPVERWSYYDDNGTAKIEVWPIPASAQTLRLRGQRPLKAFAADADVCDLDDLLIVLFTAAEVLQRRKMSDAPAKLAMAQAHFNKLKGTQPRRGGGVFVLGGGTGGSVRGKTNLTGRPTIAISGS